MIFVQIQQNKNDDIGVIILQYVIEFAIFEVGNKYTSYRIYLQHFCIERIRRPTSVNQAGNAMNGRVCIVTGANTGIGKATATALAFQGAKVVLGCRSIAKVKKNPFHI